MQLLGPIVYITFAFHRFVLSRVYLVHGTHSFLYLYNTAMHLPMPPAPPVMMLFRNIRKPPSFIGTMIAQTNRESYRLGHRKNSRRDWRESDIFNLTAEMLQHFADILHGLGQILHDFHILNTSKSKCGKFTETGRR